MISGSANYIPGNIPWERVIELWKLRFHGKDFDSFEEYVDDFRNFLKDEQKINDKSQNNIRLQYDLRQFIRNIPPMRGLFDAKNAFETIEGRRWTSEVDTRQMLERLEEACYEDLRNFDDFLLREIEKERDKPNQKERFEKECAELKKYEEENIGRVAATFAGKFGIESSTNGELEQLFIDILTKHVCLAVEQKDGEIFPSSCTMITIVGFGYDDIRPRMIELRCGWDPRGSRRTSRKKWDTTIVTEGFHIRKHQSVTDTGRLKVLCESCFNNGIIEEMEGEPQCSKCDQLYNRHHQSASAFVRGIAMKTEIDTILNGMRKESFPTLSDPNFTTYLSDC